jgi:DNA-binding NarL/FixJ family response regulator
VHQRSSPQPIRVVIADDHGLFRAGVHALLSDEPDIEVVAEFADGRKVAAEVQRARADILLLDLDMPHMDGYQVLQQLRSAETAARTILLTAIRDPEMLSRALDLGARGVVPKKGSTRQMVEAIRAVHAGMRWLDPALKVGRAGFQPERARGACAERRETRLGQPSRWSYLTDREREVAELVAGGHRYKEVARRLKISQHTVKNHLRRIFDKLEIKSRVQLALSGMQRRA